MHLQPKILLSPINVFVIDSMSTPMLKTYNYSIADNWLNNNTSYRVYFSHSSYNGYPDTVVLESINIHWIGFNPPKPWEHYTLAIIISIIMTIGLIGNFLVMCMFWRSRTLKRASNILLLNLAIADFFMLAKTPIYIYNCLKFGPASGDLACRAYGFIGGLTGTVSIMTLSAISFDRYMGIMYPFNTNKFGNKKFRAFILVVFVWVYSFIFAIMPALNIGLSKYTPEGFLTSCGFDYLDNQTSARVFMFTFFVGAWMIPFLTITYCYIQIFRVVNSTRQIQSNRKRQRVEQKLAIVVMNLIALWFLAWTPYAIVALLGIAGQQQYITPWASMIPALFCKASACINPYLYSIRYPEFKEEIFRILSKYFKFADEHLQQNASRTMSVHFVTRTRVQINEQY